MSIATALKNFPLKKKADIRGKFSYRGPGSSSPGSRAGDAVAGLFPIWSVIATELAVHQALLLLPARLLLAAHPATLPPCLATGGSAVLPVPGHPAEQAETVRCDWTVSGVN